MSANNHLLLLILGEFGGVGKSWFTKLLLEAFIKLGLTWDFVDCDRTNPNVGYAYDPDNYRQAAIDKYWSDLAALDADPEVEHLIRAVADAKVAAGKAGSDLDAARKAYEKSQVHKTKEALNVAQSTFNAAPGIYEAAVIALEQFKAAKVARPAPRQRIYFDGKTVAEQQLPDELIELALVKDTIVNLPAQTANWLDRWIVTSGLLNMEKDGLTSIFWFVVKPQPDRGSLGQFYNFCNTHPSAKVVLVKSRPTVECSWDGYLTELDLQFIANRKIVIVDIGFLELNPVTDDLLHKEYKRFSDLVQMRTPKFGVTKSQRVQTYLDASTTAIINTQLLPTRSGESTNG
jgi:hypothetical protein